MPERRLRVVPDLTDEDREVDLRTELEVCRCEIRNALVQPAPPRERWLRRVIRLVQSNRTTAR